MMILHEVGARKDCIYYEFTITRLDMKMTNIEVRNHSKTIPQISSTIEVSKAWLTKQKARKLNISTLPTPHF